MPNKPTTLRESLLKEFDQLFVEAKNHRGGRFVREEAEKLESFIVSAIDKFLTSHNTELLQKIEGLRLEIDPLSVNKRGHHTNGAHRKIRYNRALDDIIKIINQDK